MAVIKKIENENVSSERMTPVKLSMSDVSDIVNAIVETVFVELDGRVDYAPEYYEVMSAYWELGAFYPNLKIFEKDISEFYDEYIDNKYHRELSDIALDRQAGYIDRAAKEKIEFRLKQIASPLVEELTALLSNVNVLAERYAKGMDEVSAGDFKKLVTDFAEFSKKTNPKTVTDTYLKMQAAVNGNNAVAAPSFTPPKKAKRGAKAST